MKNMSIYIICIIPSPLCEKRGPLYAGTVISLETWNNKGVLGNLIMALEIPSGLRQSFSLILDDHLPPEIGGNSYVCVIHDARLHTSVANSLDTCVLPVPVLCNLNHYQKPKLH